MQYKDEYIHSLIKLIIEHIEYIKYECSRMLKHKINEGDGKYFKEQHECYKKTFIWRLDEIRKIEFEIDTYLNR